MVEAVELGALVVNKEIHVSDWISDDGLGSIVILL